MPRICSLQACRNRSHCSHPLPCPIMVALLANSPASQYQPNIGMLVTPSELKPGHRLQCQLKLWQISLWIFKDKLKHSPANSKKLEFENNFQDCKQIIFFVFVTPFSVSINTLHADFQME